MSLSAKRAFDVVVSAAALLILMPVLLAIATAIAFTGGPVLFRQRRIGQYGRPFQILKFRTMRVGAEGQGPSLTAAGDPRVTPLGRVLRRTKLDELPQLWNVLRGEMSLVGPRPEVPRYVERYTPEQRRVLELKPGITDEASLSFRDEEQMLALAGDPEGYYLSYCIPRKIELNVAYASRASVIRDFGVIYRTLLSVWFARK
jgi:lipopolysaccharide/colanic/teichoic acid biosynthesis glycosyltransferase